MLWRIIEASHSFTEHLGGLLFLQFLGGAWHPDSILNFFKKHVDILPRGVYIMYKQVSNVTKILI